MKFNNIGIRMLSQKKKKRIECHKESKAIFSNIYSIVTEISCFLS